MGACASSGPQDAYIVTYKQPIAKKKQLQKAKTKGKQALNIHVQPEFAWIARDLKPSVLGKKKFTLADFHVENIIGTGLTGQVRLARLCPPGSEGKRARGSTKDSRGPSKGGKEKSKNGSDRRHSDDTDSPGQGKANTYCVIKKLSKQAIVAQNSVEHMMNEKQILTQCRHPFIVRLFGTMQDDHSIYYILEYVVGGELFTRLFQKKKFSCETAKFYAAELLSTLDYVHTSGFMHRDIKPENILIDHEGHIKLVDFGFAKEPDTNGRCYSRIGTPQYLSPEQLDKKGGYTKAVDWWAFACVLYELLHGQTPFARGRNEPRHAIYLRVMSGKISFKRSLEPDVKDMLRQMLKLQLPDRLVDAEKIKSHDWFCSIDWKAVIERRMVPPHIPEVLFPGDCHHFDTFQDEDGSKQVSAGKRVDQGLFRDF